MEGEWRMTSMTVEERLVGLEEQLYEEAKVVRPLRRNVQVPFNLEERAGES